MKKNLFLHIGAKLMMPTMQDENDFQYYTHNVFEDKNIIIKSKVKLSFGQLKALARESNDNYSAYIQGCLAAYQSEKEVLLHEAKIRVASRVIHIEFPPASIRDWDRMINKSQAHLGQLNDVYEDLAFEYGELLLEKEKDYLSNLAGFLERS